MKYELVLSKFNKSCKNWVYSLYINDLWICSFFCAETCYLKLKENWFRFESL